MTRLDARHAPPLDALARGTWVRIVEIRPDTAQANRAFEDAEAQVRELHATPDGWLCGELDIVQSPPGRLPPYHFDAVRVEITKERP